MYKVELTLKDDETPSIFYLTDNFIVRTFKTQSGCSIFTQNMYWDIQESQEEVINKIDNAIQYWVEYNATINRHGR